LGKDVTVLQAGWEQTLANNKQAYALEFVQTPRFIAAFPASMTPAGFVDRLNQNAGDVLSPSERATAISLFGGAADSGDPTARAGREPNRRGPGPFQRRVQSGFRAGRIFWLFAAKPKRRTGQGLFRL